MRKIIFALLAGSVILQACNSNKENKIETMELDNKIIECGDYKFTQSLNLENGLVKSVGNILYLAANGTTDLFCDPKGAATNTSAPLLFSTVDNTKPFTFTAKVQPQFTEAGTYSAGAILAFVDKTHWQKLCFEQDEDGNHRIVTVRTVETSDDNNHDRVDAASVYLRMSSDTKVIGNYYSEDGKNWHLVRIYKNEYPAEFYLSISAQCPKDWAHTCLFSDVKLEYRPVTDFRKGNM